MADEIIIVKSANLTAIQEAEFTLLNALAFDLLRVTSQKDGTHTACWLCMSDEAKQEARAAFLKYLDQVVPGILPHAEKAAEHFANDMPSTFASRIAKWREAEIEYKRLRDEGNPWAYFAD